MKQWLTIAELQRLGLRSLPRSAPALRKLAAGWQARPREGKGGGVEYAVGSLPEAAQAHYHDLAGPADASTSDGDRALAWARFERLPESAREEASRRLAVLDQVDRRIEGGAKRMAAYQATSTETGTPIATLRRWLAAVADVPRADRLPALAPAPRGRPGDADCPPEAWDQFFADYMRPEGPSAAACYWRLQRTAEATGWTLPSLRTMERLLDRRTTPEQRILAREGPEALARVYPAQKRDRSALAPCEAVTADGHTFDVLVRFPDGTVTRPVGLFWQDLYSGRLLAYRIDRAPSAELVRLSFADLLRDAGVPARAYLDNGREFAAKSITGGQKTRFRFKVKEEDRSCPK